jgi:ADP-ribose pyrophosphatase YjhB (NUDIX family)
VSVELLRHVNAVVADLAAEHGEIDLVGRRIECSTDAYDALRRTFEAAGVIGGAGIRVRSRDGAETLFVRYEGADGWVDPGDSRRPGESYRECAKRGVREATGIEATVEGLAQVQLLYMDDPTARDPIPNPYLSFAGTRTGGEIRPGEGVDAARWMAEPPETLLYGELAELPLAGKGQQE